MRRCDLKGVGGSEFPNSAGGRTNSRGPDRPPLRGSGTPSSPSPCTTHPHPARMRRHGSGSRPAIRRRGRARHPRYGRVRKGIRTVASGAVNVSEDVATFHQLGHQGLGQQVHQGLFEFRGKPWRFGGCCWGVEARLRHSAPPLRPTLQRSRMAPAWFAPSASVQRAPGPPTDSIATRCSGQPCDSAVSSSSIVYLLAGLRGPRMGS